MMEKYKSKDVVWAIFLIFIGLIFLLNTTGTISWSIWTYILNFWPVFIILAGIKLVLGDSLFSEIFLSILAFVVFVFVGVFSYVSYSQSRLSFLPDRLNDCIMGGCMAFTYGDMVEKQMVVSFNDYEENFTKRELNVDVGAGYFEITDSDVSDYVTVQAKYPSRYSAPVLDSEKSGDSLKVGFSSGSFTGFHMPGREDTRYNIVLGSKDVLTDAEINLGAGEGLVDLDEVLLGSLSADLGAGKLVVKLDERSIPTEKITLEVGAGDMELILPEGVGYTLEYDLGLGSINIDGEEIANVGIGDKTYESENYNSAELKVLIVVTVGVGSLDINTK